MRDKKILLFAAGFLGAFYISWVSPAPFQNDNAASTKPIQIALTCFKKGEYTSGFNKICIYDCLGSDTAITIKAVELCPLTIQR